MPMRDVFYYNTKPNAHPRERFAENLEQARLLATTEHFWIINEFCDYRNFDWDFDFEFLPDEDVWAEEHNNVWPSQHQKDSGTWLCPKENSEVIIYRGDVDHVIHKNIKHDNWIELDLIDHSKFDFSWHPDPSDPPFIYKWGCKFFPAQLKHVLEYRVTGATQEKYMTSVAELLVSDCWLEHQEIDKHKFDMSWRPNPLDPPYIYMWGNKYIAAQLRPTLEYHAPGATEIKYMPDLLVVLPEWDNWVEVQAVDKSKFDFSWRPDPREPAYIYTWGNKYIDGELKPTLEYHCENATEIKYMSNDVPVLPEMARWKILEEIEKDSFDFSWRPNPREPAYIYVFGNQYYDAIKMPTLEYHCDGATERKYMDLIAELSPNPKLFEHLEDSYLEDYSWHPDPDSPPYIYVWGNQWNKPEDKISIQYVVPGATEYRYMEERATRKPNKENFRVLLDNVAAFDYSWEPDPNSPPYTYVFGNQWYKAEIEPTIEYPGPEGAAIKYVNAVVASLGNDMTNWTVPANVDKTKFDFSWHPNPGSPPYIYEFATVWNKRGGPVYTVPGATEYKYIEDIKAGLLSDKTHWDIPAGVDSTNVDFSWVPHPEAPPYIYQFATKLDDIWVDDGPRYNTPGNDEVVVRLENSILFTGEITYPKYTIETTLEDLVNQHPTEQFWALNKNINYDDFDFSWKPDKENLFNVTVFGSTESELTHTYFVNATYYLDGYTDFNYIQPDTELDAQYLTKIFVKPDMFYVDKGNSESATRFEMLKERFGNKIQKTRYLNSWVDTVNRCINRSTTDLLWVLNSELDYDNFNFDYYPNPWQMKMVQVFGTQWSHWGTTFMVNRETFSEDTKYVKIIEHLPTLNFVKDIRAAATTCAYDIVVIDHGNDETTNIVESLKQKESGKHVTIVKYDDSYLTTIRNLVNSLPEKKEHYLWLCSSVCDYSNFDFSYICDPFARDNLHVFPSGRQKFGDTFLIDINKTREIIGDLESLDDYQKVNYNGTVKAERLPAPEIVTSSDTLVDAVKTSMTRSFPYAVIMTEDNINLPDSDYEPMNLWAEDTKNIIITATGATRIIVPSEASEKISKELYDYPYIKRAPKLVKSNPIDIVFLSNGETGADENWEHLLKVTNGLPNRVVRVDGVNGRVAAYHAAAEASNTPWMFTVFAKLKVSPRFDWNWQPDRMQVSKHYIFHAKNPVNGLIYGHQAMIAYNKKLTLANEGCGLDFTLDDEHEVVPLTSGTAHYNTDPFSTWRTSFREVLKLKADDSEESRDRLDAWLNKAEGDYSEYSIKGSLDASKYYDEVEGDFDKLKLSYEWAWLREKFNQI